MNILNDKIDFFFRPTIGEPTGNSFSSLYLLRRDIFTCLGYDPNTMNPISNRALWPGVMCILAGIDLLGKYLEGDDIKSSVTTRFKKYYEKYFDKKGDCEIVYQLRNSMLHSFGLYSFKTETFNKIKVKTQEYYFVLDCRDDNVIVIDHEINVYTINIIALCNAFEISIDRFLNDIRNNDDLKLKFDKMFPFYAGITVR